MTQRLPYRARLTSAYTAVVALAVIVLGAIAFFTVRVTIESALDTRLSTTAQAIRSVIDIRHGKLVDLDAEDHEQFLQILGQSVDAAVLRPDGSVMASDLSSPPKSVISAIVQARGSRGSVQLGHDNIVFATMPITEGGHRLGSVAAWDSRGAYDEAVSATLLSLTIAGLVVIAIAVAVGGWLSGQLLRPVRDLSAMISTIEATDLTERLRWDGADDELGKLCVTFDRLLDRLEGVVARERRFIADASHELRTPLSVMRAEVELALMYERTPEAYRDALLRMQRETRRLEQLAQSLLLTARQEAVVLASETVALTNAVERATNRMQPLAQTRGISLTFASGEGATVTGDAEMLERAVEALIENAVRFAPDDGNIRIYAGRAENRARITVRDDGPGFSAIALREATTRFWREDASRSGIGTGLGLSIVRAIVERHSGTIELRNAESGTGAVVVLTLPAIFSA